DELRAELCRAYFGRDDPQQLARMNLFALMSDVGWTLWGAIQAKISEIDYDFKGYYGAVGAGAGGDGLGTLPWLDPRSSGLITASACTRVLFRRLKPASAGTREFAVS